MYNTKPLKVSVRHGLAEPISVDLAPEDVARVATLPALEGVEFILSRVPPAQGNGHVSALRETLRDPQCVLEIKQGDLVRVVTRRNPMTDITQTEFPQIEIGVSKSNRGG